MPAMILQMTGVTALYVAVTALLWRLWKKTERHTLLHKLAVGLFYGLCSVAANHFGILYGDMILNVRDIGPLAAGLFFDPLSGVLSGLMRCANAGHEYPVLMRAGGDYELLKDKHGLVLAGYEDVPMKEYEIQLQSGDRLFVYTDGVPEAINENREQYGTKRLTERLNVLKDLPQQEILNGVLEDVRQFAGGEEQFDDITMLGITYTRSGPDPAGGISSAE